MAHGQKPGDLLLVAREMLRHNMDASHVIAEILAGNRLSVHAVSDGLVWDVADLLAKKGNTAGVLAIAKLSSSPIVHVRAHARAASVLLSSGNHVAAQEHLAAVATWLASAGHRRTAELREAPELIAALARADRARDALELVARTLSDHWLEPAWENTWSFTRSPDGRWMDEQVACLVAFVSNIGSGDVVEELARGYFAVQDGWVPSRRLKVLLACYASDNGFALIDPERVEESMVALLAQLPTIDRIAARRRVVEVIARRERFDAAARIAARGDNDVANLQTLVVLAAVRSGQPGVAAEYADEHGLSFPSVGEALAVGLARAGDLSAARERGRGLAAVTAQVEIARAEVAAGDPDMARRTLLSARQHVDADPMNAIALARCQADAGWYEDARESLMSARTLLVQSRNTSSIEKLCAVARSQREIGWRADVHNTLRVSAELLRQSVDLAAGAELHDGAWDDELDEIAWATADLVESLVTSQIADEAHELLHDVFARGAEHIWLDAADVLETNVRLAVECVVQERARADALGDCCVTIADDGVLHAAIERLDPNEYRTAIRLASSLTNGCERAKALGHAAVRAQMSDNRDAVLALCTTALAACHWRHCIGPVAFLDPRWVTVAYATLVEER